MKFSGYRFSIFLALFASASITAKAATFVWTEQEIDTIEIGYGLALRDVDGDGKRDVLLADKKTIQWYQNPSWQKHIIARDLTVRDNVCIAARDIDGDGRCEVAVGGQWNFWETIQDGAIHYLHPPVDRRDLWTPITLPHEPSTHRMHWIQASDGGYRLVVKPLRGQGNVDDEGYGLMLMTYERPEDLQQAWTRELVSNFLHQSHNFHPVNWDTDPEEELVVASREGVWHFDHQRGFWRARQLTDQFAGEIRDGRLPGGRRFMVTIEPMHGTTSAIYGEPSSPLARWPRLVVLHDQLKDGHALAVDDFLGVGSDQVVVGWRGMNPRGVPGIRLYAPIDQTGTQWHETILSDASLAVEDIKVADLDGDGRPEIVAAARQTKNLRIYWNRTR